MKVHSRQCFTGQLSDPCPKCLGRFYKSCLPAHKLRCSSTLECVCGKTCGNAGALENHKKSCKSLKASQRPALSQASGHDLVAAVDKMEFSGTPINSRESMENPAERPSVFTADSIVGIP
ncbi:hypothetical protein QAD02_001954 [Eretmocerus hayati]|uniref:Uncharacterized protein n=1 Tax=Eretmocerus hayati TaxID=131215 RepID=A0ACC2NMB4_9HYME|nr:hypothetical protein QAD02_001954 [Eretmocerus hayati]